MTDTSTDGQDTGLGQPLPQGADQIDRVVRLSPPWTIFVLSACALLVAGATLWAFVGVVSQTVTAQGLVSDPTFEKVLAAAPAVVDSVQVGPGDRVRAGDPLVTYTNGSATVSPSDGVVAIVYVAPQTRVAAETELLAITDPDAADTVNVLLPPSLIGTEVTGAQVLLEVNGAPPSTYGYLVGKVQQVSSSWVTVEQLAQRFSVDESIVVLAVGDQPGLLATISLELADTPSGYAWTVGEGPNFQLVQGGQVTARVILSQQNPISALFPSLGGLS